MFRFTIRDVLWLTVVVGLGVGWWLSSRRFAEIISAKDNEIRSWKSRPVNVRVGDVNRPTPRGQKMIVEIGEDGSVGFTPMFADTPPAR